MTFLNIDHRGLMLVLSSPSGAGKTTISRKLLERDKHIDLSISATTRPRRPGEVSGQDYLFKSVEDFNDMIEQEAFLEHAKVFGHYYGTPRKQVEDAVASGQDVLFDIDWQGTQQLKEKAREDLVSVFILPPSMRELERRLKSRAQDSQDVVAFRMSRANEELSHWAEYDYILVNHDLADTVQAVQEILNAERLKRHRRTGITQFVKSLKEGQ